MRSKRVAALPILVVAMLLGVTACGGAATTEPTASPRPAAPSTTPPPVDPVAAWVDERMSQLTMEQKAAALLMLHAPGTDPAALRAYVDAGVSGLILMGDNVPAGPTELAAITAAVQSHPEAPVLLGMDEEGGEVQRLPWDHAAGAEGLRSEQAAAERVAAAVSGEQGVVLSTLKHFPGHGAAPGDSHSSVPEAPLTIDEWRAGPAIPFGAGIDAGAEIVMTGHLRYPAVDPAPASLSPEWHRILRDELGFDGVVVSDDTLMLQHNGLPEHADPGENAVRAVAAGADLLLHVLPADPSEFGISVDGLAASIVATVQSGRISESRLDEAVERVLTLRRSLVE